MKIAAYCRVSTDKDEQIDSLIHQKEFFVEYANEMATNCSAYMRMKASLEHPLKSVRNSSAFYEMRSWDCSIW